VRNLGGKMFFTVRDHTGTLQFLCRDDFPEAAQRATALRMECCVRVAGEVIRRSDPNPNMPTGMVEVVAEEIDVLNAAGTLLPFSVSATEKAKEVPGEETRLKHRVLDLRRQQMQRNLRLRGEVVRTLRRYLEDEHGFLELETPVLTKSTPEGARDYLVPSRSNPGEFYALPQSPQLFKQLFMVSGFDRYYQIARCFRDEDLRADRQPEFTQLDMEVAFMDQDAVLSLVEGMVRRIFQQVLGLELPEQLPRLTYAEAMGRYGSDKPDTRFGLELSDVTGAVADSGFKVFSGAVAAGGVVKACRVPDGKRVSNGRVKPKGDVAGEAVKGGAAGLVYVRVGAGGEIDATKPVREGLSASQAAALIEACGAEEGDLLLLAAGPEATVNRALDRVRLFLGKDLGEIDESKHNLLWVVDFPMFEWNEEEGRLEALHHPFTAPKVEDMGDLRTAKAQAYDLVWNGVEVGGGSLRIYNSEVQREVFRAIGLGEEEAQAKFGFLLEALNAGAPPHGGLAFGVDRLAMLLCAAKYGAANAASIRDVIAFPKTAAASCLLTGAPSGVDAAQLGELGIGVTAAVQAAPNADGE